MNSMLCEVNLAFNLTLLWQFVGVLFTPAWGPRDAKGQSLPITVSYHPLARSQARTGTSSPIKRE